jgi:hypothetical protein
VGERTRRILACAVPAGLVLSGLLVWHSSSAAFTAETSNPGNSFSAGTVTLSDDDTGTAMFTVTGLRPGSTGTNCLAVGYTGSLAAAVRLYVAPGDYTGTGLGTYLSLTVDEGTGGAFGSCSGFSGSSIYSGTLANLASSSTDSATGVGTWAPTGSATRTYRFTYTLADNNSAAGLNSQVTFTWQASST